jgi:uncharacterized membrane protein YiaA
MIDIYTLYQRPALLLLFISAIVFWDLIWRGIGLWHAARHGQKGWFIALLLLNTVGILPIIYLIGYKPKRTSQNIVLTKSVKNGKKPKK